jgi:hypothetical protein
MDFLDKVWQYFRDDPLRLLTVLGGSGGLAYWVDRLRNRPRLKLRLVSERFHDNSTPAKVEFEAINVGNEPTAIEPIVRLVGYTPTRRRRTFDFAIQSLDRQLPAQAPKLFIAESAQAGVLSFFNSLLHDLPRDLSCFGCSEGHRLLSRVTGRLNNDCAGHMRP